MKKIKEVIKLLAFMCLIVLASIGVGLSGGVPLPTFKSRRDPIKEKIELIEDEESREESKKGSIKG
jgi:hypothetical protein